MLPLLCFGVETGRINKKQKSSLLRIISQKSYLLYTLVSTYWIHNNNPFDGGFQTNLFGAHIICSSDVLEYEAFQPETMNKINKYMFCL